MEALIKAFMPTADKFTNKFKPRSQEPDNDLSAILQDGDIILDRLGNKTKITAKIITFFTQSPYNHTEVHLKDGYMISASEYGVTYADVYERKLLDVFRLKGGLTREQRLVIFAKAAQSVLKPYDYAHLVLFPFMNKKLATKKAGNDAYICSELVAWLYQQINVNLMTDGRLTSMAAPADIGNATPIEYIGTFNKGWEVIAKPNEFSKFDNQDEAGKGLTNFLKLLSTNDEFYEGLNTNRKKME